MHIPPHLPTPPHDASTSHKYTRAIAHVDYPYRGVVPYSSGGFLAAEGDRSKARGGVLTSSL